MPNNGPLVDRYLLETLKNSPLIYWRMREGSGTTVLDSSPNVKNGTYSGTGINWTSTGIGGYARSSGKDAPLFNSTIPINDFTTSPPSVIAAANNAYFDGAAGQATATLNSPAINTGVASVVTLEMWVKWDGALAGSNGTYEAIANFGGATGLLLGFLKVGAADYRFGLSVRNAGDLWGLNNATTLALLQKDIYNHILFTIVNNNVQTSKLYINGNQAVMSQQVGTSTTTDSVTSAFALAYDGTASFFGGSIAEVAVYNGEPFNALAVKNRFHMGAFGGAYNEVATLPGLETMVEFVSDTLNAQVVMNDKTPTLPGNRSRTLDQYYLSEIGGLDDADIRFAEESNFYRDGTNPLLSRYGGRTITFDGYIEAMNIQSMRQLTTKLKKAINSPSTISSGISEGQIILRNVWDNGFDFGISARKSAPLQIKEVQQTLLPRRNFLITMRASYPFFESIGSRTEVVQMNATTMIAHKGNAISLPVITFWGPYSDARLLLNTTAIITGTVAASSFVQIDCKNRTCTDWTKFNVTGDFPYLIPGALSDTWQNFAQFNSITGGTAGVTRVEITWKHTMI